jgi:hypothetical protein
LATTKAISTHNNLTSFSNLTALNEQLNSLNSFSPVIQNVSQTNKLKLILECNSNLDEVWITALVVYKIIMFMYGIYLAWIIRNITVPSMNDSKYLLFATYTILICGLGSLTLTEVIILFFYKFLMRNFLF